MLARPRFRCNLRKDGLMDDLPQPPMGLPAPPESAGGKTAKAKKVVLPHASYQGGLSTNPKAKTGNLCADMTAIGIGMRSPSKPSILWTEVAGVSFDSDTMKRSRKGAAMMIGVGALLMSNRKDVAQMIVVLHDGTAGLFEVEKMSGMKLRGKLSPVLNAVGVQCLDDATPVQAAYSAPPGTSIGDELAKVAELHESGVLSDDEFSAAKAAILSTSTPEA